ncbi:eukaryotic mitochondrial regulator protein-domain-containing protein [Stachybotrys elegans]|uniref:Eukaryotic mitochondrial regulator protein-domain-containing protein n=1 Tax=Stachybotrys elegans TaxID=80388 RepID=A0A8K0WMC2_9HYPO|nr:eukaryotic mitochondrial regulator protein-domain-containing protein [Stachybotrys elegans]
MPPRVRAPALTPSLLEACPHHASSSRAAAAPLSRGFSTTACRERMTKGRFKMFQQLARVDMQPYRDAPDRYTYLGPFVDQPFPNNPLFRSQSVLSDMLKDVIYTRVVEEGQPLKVVSAELGVDVRRVAAVIRLREVENQFKAEGKKLATPYAKAVMKMLPKTHYDENEAVVHEPINEITVHEWTKRQLFVPTSESRHFTREDAAKAFSEDLLSADGRSAHQNRIKMEKKVLRGTERDVAAAEFRTAAQREEEKFARRLQKAKELEDSLTKRFSTDRFEFRIKTINAETVGVNGRSPTAVGWRYGAPHEDRKKGLVKIPSAVP